jgi:hypothetical protein
MNSATDLAGDELGTSSKRGNVSAALLKYFSHWQSCYGRKLAILGGMMRRGCRSAHDIGQ